MSVGRKGIVLGSAWRMSLDWCLSMGHWPEVWSKEPRCGVREGKEELAGKVKYLLTIALNHTCRLLHVPFYNDRMVNLKENRLFNLPGFIANEIIASMSLAGVDVCPMRLVILERIGCNVQRFQHFVNLMIVLHSTCPMVFPHRSLQICAEYYHLWSSLRCNLLSPPPH